MKYDIVATVTSTNRCHGNLTYIDERGAVILFSNDNMLCAKAKMNDIIACDRMVSFNLMATTITVTIDRVHVHIDILTSVSCQSAHVLCRYLEFTG